MADYVLMTDLSARLPGKFLIQALDDDKDGLADLPVFESIQKTVKEDIDGRIGQRYEPYTFGANPPALLKSAAAIFAMELLYSRRGIDAKNNPMTGQANAMRAKLDDIGNGKQPLIPIAKPTNASGIVVAAAAKTVSRSGRSS